MQLIRLYRTPCLSVAACDRLLAIARAEVTEAFTAIDTEHCFYVDAIAALDDEQLAVLRWFLCETFAPGSFGAASFLDAPQVVEVGPRMSFTTAWSTNAVSILRGAGLGAITRIERSRRYGLRAAAALSPEQLRAFAAEVHDRMTEMVYPEPLVSFASGAVPAAVFTVPLVEEGRKALERINREMGLALDDWDLDYYTQLFVEKLGRNPTSVECFDIAQSNSEHSRHWFFKGKLVVDGQPAPQHLLDMVRAPLEANRNNSTIAFADNSSAIRGAVMRTLVPARPGEPSPLIEAERDYDISFTAETHNFPSGVAPFPGAETGTGGRIRDGHATGRGSLVVAGTAAYCVGNLRIPGDPQPWEPADFAYPAKLAAPLQIEIEASNGASDYGNKFGEPLIQGYTRSFGLRLANGERREWLKPIMFSGGVGQLDASHRRKGQPEVDMWVVKLGGPAYRIGIGGGAASSMIQGENAAELDFNAVQRGDAEMEQKANRVIRACVELGAANPIVSIHDQGAGGNCNVVKEIVHPAGARIEVRDIPIGDDTLSVLEIWGAEYQEQDALLVRAGDADRFRALCAREKVEAAFIGRITGDGRIVLHDRTDGSTPVDLDLDDVLGDMPQKTFHLNRVETVTAPLTLPAGLTAAAALGRVLRLVSVGSKRFLTSKVDRSVTGLVARQQCVGPLQVTVADVAVIAQSHQGVTGAAISIGEQPLKGLIDPAAMARLTVAEALTNLVWAEITDLADVKCSGNWMWAAKLAGEGAALYDAAAALRDVLIELGIAIDGGKDSLSMAALAPRGSDSPGGDDGQPGGGNETVKAPGTLVISAYAVCPDVTSVVTPELSGDGALLWIPLTAAARLGGSALAQVYGQVGDEAPDLDDPALLGRAFRAVQGLIHDRRIVAGHDCSDGGLVVALLEMAFAGDCGLDIDVPGDGVAVDSGTDPIAVLFAEEPGLVIEVAAEDAVSITADLAQRDVRALRIGRSIRDRRIRIAVGGQSQIEGDTRALLEQWEQTSYQLDRLQTDPACAAAEHAALIERPGPRYHLGFTPALTPAARLQAPSRPRVAIVREEGSNSDREMSSAFHGAGFETWDVTMTDLHAGRVTLEGFRGVAFVGGFSYGDVLDSAKGWAGGIRFNPRLAAQFDAFLSRDDSFSLGVCNGCQLMALAGYLPWRGIADTAQPRFIHNASGRFESRFATVRIDPSPSILLRGMEGSTLGIWSAHGEGRAFFPDPSVLERVEAEGLAPIRYVDDAGATTEGYPFNPNGATHGIAALCSPDGRHLALMPHPERTHLKWQWGWMPREWQRDLAVSPWLRMFQNAREWVD